MKSSNGKIIADKASIIVIIVNIRSENRIVGHRVKFEKQNDPQKKNM